VPDRLARGYRRLLLAYSREFREAYGADMTEAFRARCLRALAARGRLGLVAWTCRAVLDVAWNAPLERLSSRRDRRRTRSNDEADSLAHSPWSSGDPIMTRFAHDVRFALRVLARRPSLTVTLVLTLGLGAGATTALFSIVDAALVRPLPYPDPDRILLVQQNDREFGAYGFAPPYLVDLRERLAGVQSLAGFSASWELSLTELGEPRAVVASFVTDGLFEVLGVAPTAGRLFDRAEHTVGGPPAVVVSRPFWDRNFGPATPIGGQALKLAGDSYPIVGVMPAFPLPITASLVDQGTQIAELWLPFAANPYAELRSIPVMNVIGRLPERASLERVAAELRSVEASLARDYPETSERTSLTVARLRDVVTRDARRTVLTLFAAATLLLLIACVNVANLLLARAAARSHELAVRRSLGASRRQIAYQMLAESLVIAAMGCAAGLALGAWLTTNVLATGLAGLPPSAEVRVDLRMAAFATVLVVATAVLFGLGPALHAARGDPAASMRGGGRATWQSRRLRSVLVAMEVALAVTLLGGAGLLGRSLWALVHVDPGFRAEGVLKVPLAVASSSRTTADSRRAFLDALWPALRELPDVEQVAAVNRLPLEGGNVFVGVEVEGVPSENPTSVDRRVATPGYFDLMGTSIVMGREFGADDQPESSVPAAIVNESFVRRFWPARDALGRRLRLMLRSGPGPWLTVVGVTGDVRHHGLGRMPQPEVYVPYAQAAVESMVVVLRTSGDPADLTGPAREAVWRLDPNLPLDDAGTVESLVRDSVAEPRFRTLVLNGFAVFALVLAAIGIYGLISHTVEQRRRETGVRIALGARPGRVVWRIVSEGLVFTGLGALLGLGGAWALGQVLSGFLFGVEPADLLTFSGVSAVVLLVAFSASYLPARRAAHVDPVEALRGE
jgi:predicted permease